MGKFLQSIEFKDIPLGITFDSSNSLNVLTRKPNITKMILDGDCFIEKAVDKDQSELETVLGAIKSMPKSLFEVDESSGKLKVTKKNVEESKGFVKHEPLLDRERVETYKAKAKRRKKR